MIRLNCFFKAADEASYDNALGAAMALTECSLKHPGCLGYDVFQSATRPGIFTIVESWADQASLDVHGRTPEFKSLFPNIC